MTQTPVVVVGGGAAGMMAALAARRAGAAVVLLEPNEKLGRKLYITGKGRCNLTNNTTPEGVLAHVTRNGRFLYSAVTRFPPAAVMEYFEALGVPLKTERGGRVFPCSDRAADVIDALFFALKKEGVVLRRGKAEELRLAQGRVVGVSLGEESLPAGAVILATGGLSYPATGSTGDGYRLAQSAGHTIVPPTPSLVPLEEAGDTCAQMQGLSLKNVTLTLKNQKKKVVFQEQGEMLFTHFGLSGPLVLSASAHANWSRDTYTAVLDLKPALEEEKLEARILRDIAQAPNKAFHNFLEGLLPRRMVPVMGARVDIAGERPDQGPAPAAGGGHEALCPPPGGAPAHPGGHCNRRRRQNGRGGPGDHDVQKDGGAFLRGRDFGSGRLYRGLQPPDCLVHRPGSGRGRGPIQQGGTGMRPFRSIAIDGPSGAGKSTLAKALAARLGFLYVDTGAIYRTVGLYVARQGGDCGDPQQVLPRLPELQLSLTYGADGLQHMLLAGEDVTQAIRENQVSRYASQVSAYPAVRAFLLEMQRSLARTHDVIMDGRDIGTVVLPQADLKIFLTASVEERARRRCRELQARGAQVDLATIQAEIAQRDYADSHRSAAPLRKAADAVVVDTSQMDREESLAALITLAKERLGL